MSIANTVLYFCLVHFPRSWVMDINIVLCLFQEKLFVSPPFIGTLKNIFTRCFVVKIDFIILVLLSFECWCCSYWNALFLFKNIDDIQFLHWLKHPFILRSRFLSRHSGCKDKPNCTHRKSTSIKPFGNRRSHYKQRHKVSYIPEKTIPFLSSRIKSYYYFNDISRDQFYRFRSSITVTLNYTKITTNLITYHFDTIHILTIKSLETICITYNFNTNERERVAYSDAKHIQ